MHCVGKMGTSLMLMWLVGAVRALHFFFSCLIQCLACDEVSSRPQSRITAVRLKDLNISYNSFDVGSAPLRVTNSHGGVCENCQLLRRDAGQKAAGSSDSSVHLPWQQTVSLIVIAVRTWNFAKFLADILQMEWLAVLLLLLLLLLLTTCLSHGEFPWCSRYHLVVLCCVICHLLSCFFILVNRREHTTLLYGWYSTVSSASARTQQGNRV